MWPTTSQRGGTSDDEAVDSQADIPVVHSIVKCGNELKIPIAAKILNRDIELSIFVFNLIITLTNYCHSETFVDC